MRKVVWFFGFITVLHCVSAADSLVTFEDDQSELLIIATTGNATLAGGSMLANLLATYPAYGRIAEGKIEWKKENAPFDKWRSSDDYIAPAAEDAVHLAGWLRAPWVVKHLKDYTTSDLGEAHVQRAISAASDSPDLSTKTLALASAGGRMSALSHAGFGSMNLLAKQFKGGPDAVNALAKVERLKLSRLVAVAASAGARPAWPDKLKTMRAALETAEGPAELRLILAVAYTPGPKPRLLWGDFAPNRNFAGGPFRREIASWAPDARGVLAPCPLAEGAVHTCNVEVYQYVIVVGHLDEKQQNILLRSSIEEMLARFGESGPLVLLSRPGSPVLGGPPVK